MYTFMPTGGVIRPHSMTMIITTPYQTMSKPRASMMGWKMGTVSMTMARESMKQPRMTYMMMTATSTT